MGIRPASEGCSSAQTSHHTRVSDSQVRLPVTQRRRSVALVDVARIIPRAKSAGNHRLLPWNKSSLMEQHKHGSSVRTVVARGSGVHKQNRMKSTFCMAYDHSRIVCVLLSRAERCA